MISRLIAFAASLAIVAGASFAFSASAQQAAPSVAAKQAVPIIQLERVVVIGKRVPADAR